MQTISTHAALIYVMVIVSAADGAMNDAELRAIGDLSRVLPAFRGFDPDKLIETARDCSAILQEPDGLSAVLGLIEEALPPALRETAQILLFAPQHPRCDRLDLVDIGDRGAAEFLHDKRHNDRFSRVLSVKFFYSIQKNLVIWVIRMPVPKCEVS